MNNQIDKLQMLFTLEKGELCEQFNHQKKQAVLSAIVVAFFILVLLSINVAIFCHISELNAYAKSAWVVALGNTVLALIPLAMLFKVKKKTAQEVAADDIRQALMAEFKENLEQGAQDVKYSVEKVQELSKDIRTFSEGGLTALIPLIKLASGAVDQKVIGTKRKPKSAKKLKQEDEK